MVSIVRFEVLRVLCVRIQVFWMLRTIVYFLVFQKIVVPSC
jgi:hypothetical protein